MNNLSYQESQMFELFHLPIFDVLFLYEKRSDFEIAIKQTNNRKDLEKQIVHDTTASVHPQD